MFQKFFRISFILCIALHVVSCTSSTEPEPPVQGVTLQGLDVSHHNIDAYAPVDWIQVRDAGYIFAFVKATDGYNSCWTDPTFTSNMKYGHAAGLFMGAYHFARPDLNPDATVEARCFVQIAGKYLIEGYLRPVLDLETGANLGKQTLTNWVHTWMNTVKNLTGVEPIFYTYANFTYNLDVSVTRYDFWLAHYTGDPDVAPNPGIWPGWDFWQYTDQGTIPGVSSPSVDLNLFNGDLSRLLDEFVITTR